MQGINKAKHSHLMDALLGLERLVSRHCADGRCLQEVAEHRDRLVNEFEDYERLLTELANLIANYEVLCSEVKVQFLAKRLKSLKKEIAVEHQAITAINLKETIKLSYAC